MSENKPVYFDVHEINKTRLIISFNFAPLPFLTKTDFSQYGSIFFTQDCFYDFNVLYIYKTLFCESLQIHSTALIVWVLAQLSECCKVKFLYF